MSVLKSKNLAYEIAELLGDRIIKMEYRPGDRIVESKIAQEFEVSQSPIREALRILEQNGLVEINQRKGTYVTELSINSINMLYDIITELYALLIRKAMENKTDASVRKALDMIKRIESSAEKKDVEKYYKNIFELALIAIETVNSSLLKKIFFDLWPNKRRVEYMTLKKRRSELKISLKYFKLLEKYMLESNTEKLIATIKEYTQDEKRIAIDIIEKEQLVNNEVKSKSSYSI